MTERYKTGGIVAATVRGEVQSVRRMRSGNGWQFLHTGAFLLDGDATDVRPLALIDPRDVPEEGLTRADVERIAREQVYDRPEEPGTWGRVEASHVLYPGRHEWVRYPDGKWYATYSVSRWSSLVDPVVIREGVE